MSVSERASQRTVAGISGIALVAIVYFGFTWALPRFAQLKEAFFWSMNYPLVDLTATAFLVAAAIILTVVVAFSSSIVRLVKDARERSTANAVTSSN